MYFDKDAHGKYHIMDMDYDEFLSVLKAVVENPNESIYLLETPVAEIKRLQENFNNHKL